MRFALEYTLAKKSPESINTYIFGNITAYTQFLYSMLSSEGVFKSHVTVSLPMGTKSAGMQVDMKVARLTWSWN